MLLQEEHLSDRRGRLQFRHQKSSLLPGEKDLPIPCMDPAKAEGTSINHFVSRKSLPAKIHVKRKSLILSDSGIDQAAL